MSTWLAFVLVYLLASLPFLIVLGRLIYFVWKDRDQVTR